MTENTLPLLSPRYTQKRLLPSFKSKSITDLKIQPYDAASVIPK